LAASARGAVLRLGAAFAVAAAARAVDAVFAPGCDGGAALATGCGASATGCCTEASATEAFAGSSAVMRSGTSSSRRLGISICRLPHGKPKPGRAIPWPPKVSCNSSECSSAETTSAKASRRSSRLLRRFCSRA